MQSLADALAEIGAELQRPHDAASNGGVCPTALELVRFGACTGDYSLLTDPPPALMHESTLATTSLLYASSVTQRIEQAPHKHVDAQQMRAQYASTNAVCVGALMMDVSKRSSLPVAVVAHRDDEARTVRLQFDVYGAPVAEMEAELFAAHTPSAFERTWLRDIMEEVLTLRRNAGSTVAAKPYDQIPAWLWTNEYVSRRDGPLPLLRLRRSRTDSEWASVERTQRAVSQLCGGGSTVTLRQLFEETVEDPSGWRVDATTQFFASPLPDVSVSDDGHDSNVSFPMSLLAVIVLKAMHNVDYSDLVPDDAPLQNASKTAENVIQYSTWQHTVPCVDCDVLPLADIDAGPRCDWITAEDLSNASVWDSHRPGIEPPRVLAASPSSSVPSVHTEPSACDVVSISERTLRQCGQVCLSKSDSAFALALAICKWACNETDANVISHKLSHTMQHAHSQLSPNDDALMDALLEAIGLEMAPQSALLVLRANGPDASVRRCTMVTHDGCCDVVRDVAVRLLSVPWCAAFVHKIDGMHAIEALGVNRRVVHLLRRHDPPRALPDVPDTGALLSALHALPSLVAQLARLLPSGGQDGTPPAEAAAKARADADEASGFKRAHDELTAYIARRRTVAKTLQHGGR